jgi:Mg2+/Co2+ transporter CorB
MPVSLIVGLIIFLALLLLLCFFFAGAETSMMALNRYRLNHLAKRGNKRARRAQKLLETPERLLGMIITGSTCATIIASSTLTFLVGQYGGEYWVLFSTIVLTIFILFFCEALPKSMAVLKPERFALPATFLLQVFIVLFSPLVWLIQKSVRAVLGLIGMSVARTSDHLSPEELHTLIKDEGSKIPENYQQMLLQVLELEKLTVADIMIPRQDLVGIDISQDEQGILEQLLNAPYRHLPVYEKDFSNVLGFVKIREVLPTMHEAGEWSKENLLKHLTPPYIVPETTPLHKQLSNFRRLKKRAALVVDEYGEILGLITIEDLLEEIVGEFTTDFTGLHPDIIVQKDGSILLDGQVSLRELNRYFKWQLPLDGPKTLAGYLISYLQMIPESGTTILLNGRPCEILQVADNRIKMVKLYPAQ